jgi:hypothetical protein
MNNAMKKVMAIFLCVFTWVGAYSQPSIQPETVPPSPDVVNRMKFVETPVSLYTGTPQISIPLYTIREGNFSLPVTLDYNAHGIKISEIASYTGLGWSLNAGGVISRSSNGLPDEIDRGFLNSGIPQEKDYYNMVQYATGELDDQPDIFYYSFAGHNGRFVFDKSGNIHTIPEKAFKIERRSNGISYDKYINLECGGIPNFITEWIITTEDGIKYTFSDYEIGATAGAGAPESGYYKIADRVASVNSWYLSKIELPESGTITFSYTTNDVWYDIYSGGIFVYFDRPKLKFVPNVAWTRMRTYIKHLSAITFPSGQISFVQHQKDRADLVGDKALREIVIKNTAGNTLNRFEFDYQFLQGTSLTDYELITIPNSRTQNLFGSSYTTSDAMGRRLILKEIREKDAQGMAKDKGYTFAYHHDLPMPNRFYPHSDHWGYANEKEIDKPYNNPPVKWSSSLNKYIMYGKSPNIDYAKQGTLYKITHPTGGTTEFEYELHEYGGSIKNLGNPEYGGSPEKPEGSISFRNANASLCAISHFNYNGGVNRDRLYEYKASPYNGEKVKQYYEEFSINSLSISVSVNSEIKGMTLYNPNDVFGFYIENMSTHRIEYKCGHDEKKTLSLSPGTYRIYHYPYQPALDNPDDPINELFYQIYLEWEEEHTPEPTPGKDADGEKAGGLRVKKSTVYDPVSSKQIVKTYKYIKETDGDGTSGILFGWPFYRYTWKEGYYSNDETDYNNKEDDSFGGNGGGLDNSWSDRHFTIISFNSLYPLGSTQNSYVGYSRVEETSVSDGKPNGKSCFKYTLNRDTYPHPPHILEAPDPNGKNQYPYPPGDSREWMNGMLLEQKDYAFEDNRYKLVRTQENTWKENIVKITEGYKFGILSVEKYGNYKLLYSFVYTIYPVSGGTMRLEKSEKWDSGVSSTTSYEYGNAGDLPVHISQTTKSGNKVHQYFSYPNEYALGSKFIDSLKARNILNRPVEEIHAIEDASGIRITKGTLTEYNPDGTPSKVKQLETSRPIDKGSFRFSSRAVGVLPASGATGAYTPDSRYKDKILASYKQGRVSEYTDEALSIYYLWGYNNQYPIAEIKNATHEQIKSIINETTMNAIATKVEPAVSDWTLINGLQRALPNALVTTYTYKPLVGMLTSTGPSGITTYYEYDSFSRLKRTYIKEGATEKTIQTYNYHYQNQ